MYEAISLALARALGDTAYCNVQPLVRRSSESLIRIEKSSFSAHGILTCFRARRTEGYSLFGRGSGPSGGVFRMSFHLTSPFTLSKINPLWFYYLNAPWGDLVEVLIARECSIFDIVSRTSQGTI